MDQETNYSQGFARRAWADTWLAVDKPTLRILAFVWGIIVTLVAVHEKRWDLLLGALPFLAGFMLVLSWKLARTPFVQRDEARARILELQEHTPFSRLAEAKQRIRTLAYVGGMLAGPLSEDDEKFWTETVAPIWAKECHKTLKETLGSAHASSFIESLTSKRIYRSQISGYLIELSENIVESDIRSDFDPNSEFWMERISK